MSELTTLLAVCFLFSYFLNYPFLVVLSSGLVGFYALSLLLTIGGRISARKKFMISTWSEPNEGVIHAPVFMNVEPLKQYLDKILTEQGVKVTPTVAMAKVIAMALRVAPCFTSRLFMGTFFPRKSIDVSCLVEIENGKDLSVAKIVAADTKSLKEIAGELAEKSIALRQKKDADHAQRMFSVKVLPMFLLRTCLYLVGVISSSLDLNLRFVGAPSAPFGSALITSVGMLGIEQAFVPFPPYARVGLLISIGAFVKRPAVVDDKIVVQEQGCFGVTIDHRYADGVEIARFQKEVARIMSNPECLG